MRCFSSERMAVSRPVVLSLLVLSMCLAPAVAQTTRTSRAQAEARQLIAQAERVAAQLSGKDDRAYLREQIATVKAHAGDYEGARTIARALGTKEAKETILDEIATAQALAGHPEECITTIKGIADPMGKVQAYVLASNELVRVGRNSEAIALLSHAQDIKMEGSNDQMFAVCSMGAALSRAGATAKTSAMSTKILGSGPMADEISATLVTIAKAFQYDMVGANAAMAGITVDPLKVPALEAIVEANLRKGDKQSARAACRQLLQVAAKDAQLLTEQCRYMAGVQQDNGDPDGARATLQFGIDAARKSGDEFGLSDIASTQAEIGDVAGARKSIAGFKVASNSIAPRNSIAFTLAKSGDVAGALATSSVPPKDYCRAEILVGAAKGILAALYPTAAHPVAHPAVGSEAGPKKGL